MAIKRLLRLFRRKPPKTKYTPSQALAIAREYHLEEDVQYCLSIGMTADEALQEWDLYDYD